MLLAHAHEFSLSKLYLMANVFKASLPHPIADTHLSPFQFIQPFRCFLTHSRPLSRSLSLALPRQHSIQIAFSSPSIYHHFTLSYFSLYNSRKHKLSMCFRCYVCPKICFWFSQVPHADKHTDKYGKREKYKRLEMYRDKERHLSGVHCSISSLKRSAQIYSGLKMKHSRTLKLILLHWMRIHQQQKCKERMSTSKFASEWKNKEMKNTQT